MEEVTTNVLDEKAKQLYGGRIAKPLQADESEVELEKVAREFLDKVKPIVELRTKIKETNTEIATLLREVVARLDSLSDLKVRNAEKEAEVLDLLTKELNR